MSQAFVVMASLLASHTCTTGRYAAGSVSAAAVLLHLIT